MSRRELDSKSPANSRPVANPTGAKSFSLRTMFLAMTALCVLLAGFGTRWKRARDQARAVALVERELGTDIHYDFNVERDQQGDLTYGNYDQRYHRSRRWYVRPTGIDFWHDVEGVGGHPHPAILGASPSREDEYYAAIASFPRLRFIWQYPSRFEGKYLRAFRSKQTLEELHWRGDCFDTDCLQALGEFPNLRVLEFETEIDAALPIDDWSHLGKLKTLKAFSGQRTGIDDAGILALASHRSLAKLDVDHTRIGDAGARAIGALSNLETISIRDNKITSAGTLGWGRLHNLVYLFASGNAMDDATLKELAGLPRLEQLDFMEMPVTGEAFEQTGAFPSLTSLTIDASRLDPSALRAIVRLPKLDSLTLALLPDTKAKQFGLTAEDGELARIRWLSLSGESLSPSDWQAIARMPLLVELRLHNPPNILPLVKEHGALPQIKRMSLAWTAMSDGDLDELRALMPGCTFQIYKK